jgi:hypothetical protein
LGRVDRRLELRFDVLSECPLRVGCGLGDMGGTPFLILALFSTILSEDFEVRMKKDKVGTHD